MMNENNSITGHRQRLRERFLKSGLDGFHDYEIIELLLTLGTPRKDCKRPAKEALGKFGSLQAVLEADPKDLQQVKGIGPNNIFGLKIAGGCPALSGGKNFGCRLCSIFRRCDRIPLSQFTGKKGRGVYGNLFERQESDYGCGGTI